MSAVIKLGSAPAATAVVPYGRSSESAAAGVLERDPRREELARLNAQLAERDTLIEQLKKAVAEARIEGDQAGRQAAAEEAEDNREAALAQLREGIENAQRALGQASDRLEALALLVSRSALEKLFGDETQRKTIVADLIRHQLATLQGQILLHVSVSPIDFPEPEELAGLASELGLAANQLTGEAELPSGGCRMRLRLGTLQIGLDRQWSAVRELFDGLAELDGERG